VLRNKVVTMELLFDVLVCLAEEGFWYLVYQPFAKHKQEKLQPLK